MLICFTTFFLRYDKCHPRVTYCELSVGVGDLTRAWVFDVLCSFPTLAQLSTDSSKLSSFRTLLSKGHFPALENAIRKNNNCTYKFLAGFNRQFLQTSFFTNQKEAIDFLNEEPQMAIHLMLDEISKSNRRGTHNGKK